MKLLLTSNGISNPTINAALVELLGKPVEESAALVVPTGIYPFSVGPEMAARLVRGLVNSPLCELGWRSLGLLELTALPSIDQEVWESTVKAADALLFWGGDPLYLSHWVRESGLADLLPDLHDTVWVGVSAGAMAATRLIGETYVDPPAGVAQPLSTQDVAFSTPEGDAPRIFATAYGAGLTDVAVIPHLDNPNHPDASLANAEIWAGMLPVPTYAIDDQSALQVVDGVVTVVSEGNWKLFTP